MSAKTAPRGGAATPGGGKPPLFPSICFWQSAAGWTAVVAPAVLPAKDVDKVLQSSRDGAAILLVARRRLHEAHAENRRLDKASLRKRRLPAARPGEGQVQPSCPRLRHADGEELQLEEESVAKEWKNRNENNGKLLHVSQSLFSSSFSGGRRVFPGRLQAAGRVQRRFALKLRRFCMHAQGCYSNRPLPDGGGARASAV